MTTGAAKAAPVVGLRPIRSNVDIRVFGVPLDEFASGRHVVAHQHRENPVRLGGALDVHFAQNARLR